MSKRAGDFILVKDLIDAVGKDSVRFMMVYRSSQSPLDFDFDKVTDKTKENPIFYVQYACARLNSLFEKTGMDINKEIENPKLECGMIFGQQRFSQKPRRLFMKKALW